MSINHLAIKHTLRSKEYLITNWKNHIIIGVWLSELSNRIKIYWFSSWWSNDTSFTDFRKFNSYNVIKRNYFAIRVYYDDLRYTVISHHAKTLSFDLVSKIVGTYSLASFLSLFEIVDLFIEIFYAFLEEKFSKC